MNIPKFLFTEQKNSFSVYVENLESLSVEQIQAIESFVLNRKGIFDFNSYTFVIQKKLSFFEFEKLIEKSDIVAVCIEKLIVFVRKKQIGFGQYKGVFYSDLPDSYLLWLKGNYRGQERSAVDEELKKRAL